MVISRASMSTWYILLPEQLNRGVEGGPGLDRVDPHEGHGGQDERGDHCRTGVLFRGTEPGQVGGEPGPQGGVELAAVVGDDVLTARSRRSVPRSVDDQGPVARGGRAGRVRARAVRAVVDDRVRRHRGCRSGAGVDGSTRRGSGHGGVNRPRLLPNAW